MRFDFYEPTLIPFLKLATLGRVVSRKLTTVNEVPEEWIIKKLNDINHSAFLAHQRSVYIFYLSRRISDDHVRIELLVFLMWWNMAVLNNFKK